MRIGMTTVTFRSLSIDELIDLAARAGLDGLEWGGDVHVAPGEVSLARQVRAQCEAAGIEVLSYGSYYRGEGEDFEPVLQTAMGLGARIIRVWAGKLSPDRADEGAFEALASSLRTAVRLAEAEGVRIALEYHRNTMTERRDSARRLLDAVPGLMSYWQPNPDLDIPTHLQEIATLGECLSNLHVFAWGEGNVRSPLAQGALAWDQYLSAARAQGHNPDLILEFVKDDSPEQLIADAATLRQWADKWS